MKRINVVRNSGVCSSPPARSKRHTHCEYGIWLGCERSKAELTRQLVSLGTGCLQVLRTRALPVKRQASTVGLNTPMATRRRSSYAAEVCCRGIVWARGNLSWV